MGARNPKASPLRIPCRCLRNSQKTRTAPSRQNSRRKVCKARQRVCSNTSKSDQTSKEWRGKNEPNRREKQTQARQSPCLPRSSIQGEQTPDEALEPSSALLVEACSAWSALLLKACFSSSSHLGFIRLSVRTARRSGAASAHSRARFSALSAVVLFEQGAQERRDLHRRTMPCDGASAGLSSDGTYTSLSKTSPAS